MRVQARRAWHGHRHFSKGHDDPRPLGAAPGDRYRHSLLISPVDVLDTLGLDKEADEARELIASQFSFDRDMCVQDLEIAVRPLGG